MVNPARWRLLDEETRATVIECMDIDGLFVDRVFPPEPLYERYTLLSCSPSGPRQRQQRDLVRHLTEDGVRLELR